VLRGERLVALAPGLLEVPGQPRPAARQQQHEQQRDEGLHPVSVVATAVGG
jgi:hypothetical protein